MLAQLNKNITGSKTEKNMFTAFTYECRAYVRYTYYAEKARENGFNQIAEVFEKTANNELQHAKIWFKYIKGGQIPETPDNLIDASSGEHFEWNQMYADMAKEARQEGFDREAFLFESIGDIEKEHEKRFLNLSDDIRSGKVFSKDSNTVWICSNCGHQFTGKTAPETCPVCSYPQAYFETKSQNN